MSAYYFNDYDKFIGKHITVIYNCGSKCKKLDCKLMGNYKKNSKEKYITLKAYNNSIYHMNCDKIVYWTANYEDMLIENQDTYKSKTKPTKSTVIDASENLFSEKTQNGETIPLEITAPNIQLHDVVPLQNEKSTNLCSINSSKESISLIPNEDTNYDDLQENNVILSEDKNKMDTSLEPASNASIIPDEYRINYIIIDMTPNHDKVISNYKKNCDCDKTLEKYTYKNTYKKNVLRSPLAAFINNNFQGVYLTIYTASSQSISGEVIFNYDYLIVLKSDVKTYYINPEQITYFC